ncbi:MAG: extracellular solute-binding protein [Halocynthiibacter sp.]
MSITRSIGIATLVTGLAMGSAQAAVEFEWWHPLSSSKGKVLGELVDKFNAANKDIVVKPVNKGGYAETLNAGIAAFRAGKAPGLLVVLGRDTPTLMTSGANYPVYQLMADFGYKVDWSQFIEPALALFSDDKGPVSLPFNSSTPLLWYNVDAYEKAGIKSPPKTWDELGAVARKLKAAGFECALTAGWPNWVHLDAYSQMEEIEVATNNNGMDGWNTKLVFNKQPKYVNHIKRLKGWIDEGIYTYSGRTGGSAREAFSSGRCAMSLQSSSSFLKVKKQAKFRFSAAYVPYESGNKSPKNSLIGGGSLFVMAGQSKETYAAIAKFLDYLMQVPQQKFWHQNTGYVPISIAAYEEGKAEGYYKENPHQELAILQLKRGGKPGRLNRGLRFGYASQVYTAMNEELERVWAGEKEVQPALDDAARRGSDIIARFVKTIGQ